MKKNEETGNMICELESDLAKKWEISVDVKRVSKFVEKMCPLIKNKDRDDTPTVPTIVLAGGADWVQQYVDLRQRKFDVSKIYPKNDACAALSPEIALSQHPPEWNSLPGEDEFQNAVFSAMALGELQEEEANALTEAQRKQAAGEALTDADKDVEEKPSKSLLKFRF